MPVRRHHSFRALCHLLTAFDRGNRRAFGGVLELFKSGATTSKCWLRTWDSERYDEEGEQWVVTPYGHWYSLKSSTDTTIKATITFTGGDKLNGRPVCSRCPIFQQEGRPCPEMKAVARCIGRASGVVDEKVTAAHLLGTPSSMDKPGIPR
jgi:hypothetical protein